MFMLIASLKRLMPVKRMTHIFVSGTKFILFGAFIIVFAWGTGKICKDIQTARFLIGLLSENASPGMIPLASFILSSIISFATGTSYGTMAIMFPIIVPLSYELSVNSGIPMENTMQYLYASMGSILAGACFGDHCSPISDTTLFSSLSTGSDHIHHVRTQIPYALTVAFICMIAGYIPVCFGIKSWVCIPLGVACCFLAVRIFGKKNPCPTE